MYLVKYYTGARDATRTPYASREEASSGVRSGVTTMNPLMEAGGAGADVVGLKCTVAHPTNSNVVLRKSGRGDAACDGPKIENGEQVNVLKQSKDKVMAQVRATSADKARQGWLRAAFLTPA